jgi:hypothetical protein
VLSPDDLMSLALFGFKAAVLADHAFRKRRPFFKPSVREAFRNSLRIPPGVQMWLPSCDPRRGAVPRGSRFDGTQAVSEPSGGFGTRVRLARVCPPSRPSCSHSATVGIHRPRRGERSRNRPNRASARLAASTASKIGPSATA